MLVLEAASRIQIKSVKLPLFYTTYIPISPVAIISISYYNYTEAAFVVMMPGPCGSHPQLRWGWQVPGWVLWPVHWELAWPGKLPVLVMARPRDTQCTQGPGHWDTIFQCPHWCQDEPQWPIMFLAVLTEDKSVRTVWTQIWLMSALSSKEWSSLLFIWDQIRCVGVWSELGKLSV